MAMSDHEARKGTGYSFWLWMNAVELVIQTVPGHEEDMPLGSIEEWYLDYDADQTAYQGALAWLPEEPNTKDET